MHSSNRKMHSLFFRFSSLANTRTKKPLAVSRDLSHMPPSCVPFFPLLKVSFKSGKVAWSPKSPMAGPSQPHGTRARFRVRIDANSYSAAIAGAVLIPEACKRESCSLATRQAWIHGSPTVSSEVTGTESTYSSQDRGSVRSEDNRPGALSLSSLCDIKLGVQTLQTNKGLSCEV